MIDVLVIGSGFGGAVMAARLAPALKALRRQPARRARARARRRPDRRLRPAQSGGGPLNAQGNRFRNTFAPRYLGRIARVYTDTHGALPRRRRPA